MHQEEVNCLIIHGFVQAFYAMINEWEQSVLDTNTKVTMKFINSNG